MATLVLLPVASCNRSVRIRMWYYETRTLQATYACHKFSVRNNRLRTWRPNLFLFADRFGRRKFRRDFCGAQPNYKDIHICLPFFRSHERAAASPVPLGYHRHTTLPASARWPLRHPRPPSHATSGTACAQARSVSALHEVAASFFVASGRAPIRSVLLLLRPML